MSRAYTYLAILVGAICVYFLSYGFFFGQARTVRNDVVQGVLIGFGLAFVTAQAYARIKATKVNECDSRRNSIVIRFCSARKNVTATSTMASGRVR